MSFRHGLVLGKFYPLHAGHQNLIRHAQAQCDRVTVQVLAASVESIPGDVRADWIRAEHPGAHVVTGVDDLPVDFSSDAAWQGHMRVIEGLLDRPVDAVFTSDEYGAELARRLGAEWVRVDAGRVGLPVSGTAVRADVPGHWWALPPTVRSWFARRVVVVGAESTGSTTLARALGERYGVPWVPEYGRDYCERRPGGPARKCHSWGSSNTYGTFGGPWAPWNSAEFDLIATEHQRREREALRVTPHPLVISDTDNLATAVWHERYLGDISASVLSMAARFRPDLYLLTGDEIAFVQDGWRDGESVRHQMQQRFREVLDDFGVPWLEVRGPHEARLATASAAVDDLLGRGWNLADPLG